MRLAARLRSRFVDISKLRRSRRHEISRAAAVCRLLLGSAAALALSAPALGQDAPAGAAPADNAPAAAFPRDSPHPEPDTPTPPRVPGSVAAPAMIGGGVWLAEGPSPSRFGQVEGITDREVVGAVHAIAPHPSDPDVLYVGGANGGVWKTTNATASHPFWTPLFDSELSLSIGALELDPTDVTDKTLVAGIGNYSSFGFGGLLTGLLRTTDGGATWTSLGFVGSASASGISGVAPRGSTIVASSNTSDLFYCSDIGIWRSTDSGSSFSKVSVAAGVPDGVAYDLASDRSSSATLYTGIVYGSVCTGGALPNGIYQSTDTGATWAKVSDAAMDALLVDGVTNNIEITADGLDVYVDIIQYGRPAGIFHSSDGGSTWVAMDLPRTPEGTPTSIGLLIPGSPIAVDTTATGAHGLSSGMEVNIAGVTGTTGANGVWTISVVSSTKFNLVGSSDFTAWGGTGTWIKVVGLSPKEKPGSQGGIHASIRSDPTNPLIVYVGGDRQDYPFPNYIGALDYSGRLFRGDTTIAPTGAIPSPQWEHLTHSDLVGGIPGGGTASSSAPHADSREIVFDAGNELIEGDDGGIYRRTSPKDNTGDWLSLVGNLQVTEQHDVAYDAVSDVIISGNQDTGTTQQTSSGSLTWDSVHTGDGGDVAVDDSSTPGVSTRYSSYQLLGSFRRREYDASNGLLSQTFPALLTTPPDQAFYPTFVTPVTLNTVVPTRLVLGGCNAVYESLDQGDTLTQVPGLFDSFCSSGGIFSFPQNAIAYGGMSGGSPDPDVLWVGAGTGVYVRTAPHPASLVTTSTAFPGGTVTDIALDPTDSSTAYVLSATTVYQTHDGGSTWTAMTGNLTDTRLGTAAIDPGPPGRLFVGGRGGVFEISLPTPGVAAGGPFVWGELGTGLPNAPVWDLEWDATDGVLVAGTVGRGAWILQEDGTCGFPRDLVVRNQDVSSLTTFKACNTIVGGPALTVDGTIDFIAGQSVTFGDGTSLGGAVSVTIDSGLVSP